MFIVYRMYIESSTNIIISFLKNSKRNMKYNLEKKKRYSKTKQRRSSRRKRRREKTRKKTWRKLSKQRKVRAKKKSLWSLPFHRYLLIYGNHCQKYRTKKSGAASIEKCAFISSRLSEYQR